VLQALGYAEHLSPNMLSGYKVSTRPLRPSLPRSGLTLCLAMCGVAALLPSQPAAADTFADLQLGLHRDDNATRAFLDSDTYADSSAELTLSGGNFFQIAPSRTGTVFGSISSTRFNDLSGLHSNALTLGGSLEQKFGLGAYAPALSSSLSWTHFDSHSQTRDRELVALEVSYSKRLTPEWALSAGGTLEASKGLHDAVRHASIYSPRNDIYDFNQAGLFASADYTFANYAMLSASYTWVDGYTVSSALAPNPGLGALSRALTLDHAVEPPPGRKQVAYALPTRAHLLEVEYSLPIGRDSALSIGVSRQLIKANGGVDYTNNRLSLSLLHILH